MKEQYQNWAVICKGDSFEGYYARMWTPLCAKSINAFGLLGESQTCLSLMMVLVYATFAAIDLLIAIVAGIQVRSFFLLIFTEICTSAQSHVHLFLPLCPIPLFQPSILQQLYF